jgi:uncharacterized protein with GYD domain
MATYVVLANFTDQGIQPIKEVPEWLRRGEQRLQQAGGKFVAWYATQGPYDAVAVVAVPNEEPASRLVLALAREGNVRTTTLKAVAREEVERLVSSLP